VSLAPRSICRVDAVIDLLQWRAARRDPRDERPDGPWEPDEDREVKRLERAIRRLDAVASAALDTQGSLEDWAETELLAIMGALTVDLLTDAAARAERLTDRLSGRQRSAGARR
jgi:hypothetical protein